MQELRKQPVVRQKSFQQLERERIYAEYDKAHPKEVVIEDPDDPRYYMDGEEMREFDKEKLAAEEGKNWHDSAQSTREKLYAKHSTSPEPEPEVNPYDDRPDAQAACEDFRARHPEITNKDWELMNSPSFYLYAPDVPELQAQMRASGSRADMDRTLERAKDAYDTFKTQQERRAAFQNMAQQRFSNRGM